MSPRRLRPRSLAPEWSVNDTESEKKGSERMKRLRKRNSVLSQHDTLKSNHVRASPRSSKAQDMEESERDEVSKGLEDVSSTPLKIILCKIDGTWSPNTPLKSENSNHNPVKTVPYNTPESSSRAKSLRKSLLPSSSRAKSLKKSLLPILDKENKVSSEISYTEELNSHPEPRRSMRLRSQPEIGIELTEKLATDIRNSKRTSPKRSTCATSQPKVRGKLKSESNDLKSDCGPPGESNAFSSGDSDDRSCTKIREMSRKKPSRELPSARKTQKKSYSAKTDEIKISSKQLDVDESDNNKTPLRRSMRVKSQHEISMKLSSESNDSESDCVPPDSSSLYDLDEGISQPYKKIEETPRKKQSRALLSAQETPKKSYTPKKNVKTLTPSLPKRSIGLNTPTTPKDRAMVALHISKVPESLPCRDEEFDTIYKFLFKKLKNLDGGFIYVYGIPGAGKTATVERVIKRLQYESDKKKIGKFTFAEINGMHMKKPKDAYCHIWKKLENNVVSANMAKRFLEEKFNSSFMNKPLVLLIDEFDMLFDRTLSVVDTILDWIDQSKLIVVAIANSKDLIEEISKSSTKSRMFRERLCDVQFKTYTFDQLQKIIENRLRNNNVFKRDAIQLLARKSALSGDVRLALNLCRRVLTEAGDGVSTNPLGAIEVTDLLVKIYSDPRIDFIASLSRQERTLLRAIRDVILNTDSPSCSLAHNVYDQYKALCIFDSLSIKDEFSLIRMLRLLENYAFLSLSESPCTIHTAISLGNNLDLIQMAFTPRIEE